jgi:hypothetical protein
MNGAQDKGIVTAVFEKTQARISKLLPMGEEKAKESWREENSKQKEAGPQKTQKPA